MKRKCGPEEPIVLKRVKRSHVNIIPTRSDVNFHLWVIIRPYVIRELVLDQLAIETRLDDNETHYGKFHSFIHDDEHCIHDRIDFQSTKKYHSLWSFHCILSEKIYGHVWLVVKEIKPFDFPRFRGKLANAWQLSFYLDEHVKKIGVEK
jgi:hypothetical protein